MLTVAKLTGSVRKESWRAGTDKHWSLRVQTWTPRLLPEPLRSRLWVSVLFVACDVTAESEGLTLHMWGAKGSWVSSNTVFAVMPYVAVADREQMRAQRWTTLQNLASKVSSPDFEPPNWLELVTEALEAPASVHL